MEMLIKLIDSGFGWSRGKVSGKKTWLVILSLVGYYVTKLFLTHEEPDQMVVNMHLVAMGITVRATAKRNGK